MATKKSKRHATRLQFTEEERAAPALEKPITKAEKAADKLDAAYEKLPKKKNLVKEKAVDAGNGKVKTRLKFEELDKPRPSSKFSTAVKKAPIREVSAQVHRQISKREDDNAGVEAAHQTERAGEFAVHRVSDGYHSQKLKPYRAAARLEKKADKANVNALYQKAVEDNPQLSSNPLSRFQQKQAIKKQYAAAKAGKSAGAASKTAQTAKTVTAKAKDAVKGVGSFIARHPKAVLLAGILLAMVVLVSSSLSSCSMMFEGILSSVVGTSYNSKDSDLLGANEDYTALEQDLRSQVANIEKTHPGYDEYRYSVDEIGHDPYELTSYLTAKYNAYTRSEIQGELQAVFAEQYKLTLREVVEVRYRTETHTSTSTDPETGETTTDEYEVEVPYDYYILYVTLTNKTLPAVITGRLTDDQKTLYAATLETKGNKPYLWEDIYAGGNPAGGGDHYQIPGEALSDPAFAALIGEAEKYLGYPYVWGGSSPSTSFDCSGFVCWVFTNSGVHSLPRTTAEGIRQQCAIIPASEAKPGDIIFFKGTYDTAGASHVGIYVGNGMMIHCGNPIQYASINTSYWQQHFYCFGRLS